MNIYVSGESVKWLSDVHVAMIIIWFQALLKKHEALMSDLIAYGSSIQALREQAQSCRVRKDGSSSVSKTLVSAETKLIIIQHFC